MFVASPDFALSWNHSLEEMLGIIFVLGVVGAYSTLFAFTRRPWLGWAVTASVTLVLMMILIMVSPEVDRTASGRAAHSSEAS